MTDVWESAVKQYSDYLEGRMRVLTSDDVDEELNIKQLRTNLKLRVKERLSICVPQERFRFRQFFNMIIECSSRDDFSPSKLSETFVNVENYVVLLYIMPWKQEFHRIKKYCGYYQTKIESHLPNAERILELIGYRDVGNGMLILTEGVNSEHVKRVAFDCFVSSVECDIVNSIWKRTLNTGVNLRDIVMLRVENTSTEDKFVEIILSKYMKSAGSVKISAVDVSDNSKVKVNLEHGQSSIGSNDQFQDKLQTSNISSKQDKGKSSLSSSDQFRDKLQTHLQTAKKLGGDVEDIPFIDDNVKEYEYVPVDMDEQMIASLNLVKKDDHNAGSQGARLVSGMKPSQEWSFVREGLEKNYGKKYFDGLRKDILSNGFDAGRTEPRNGKVPAQNTNYSYVDPVPSVGRDSDYVTASTAFFPTVADESQMMLARGTPTMHTDTVLAKGQTKETSPRRKTEPILRRPMTESHSAQYPQPAVSASKRLSSPAEIVASVPLEYSNIKKYQKQPGLQTNPPVVKSGPIIQSNPTQYLPVVQKSSAGLKNQLGSQSYSENIKRNVNVPDSNYSKTSRSMEIQRAPLQTVSPWSCSFCTFYNNPNSLICEMCSKTPDETETDAPSGQTTRVCEQCTLENDRNSVNCHACGHKLSGAQTSV